MPSNRYTSALTRAQQQRRNETSSAARRANTQFRTAADRGEGANYSSVVNQSVRGRLGERVSEKTGRLVTGSAHRERWKAVRKAMGLSYS